MGSIVLLAFMIFVLDYGLLFWAEQRVPSGIAAVMMATIPVFMALSEIILLRTQKPTVRLALALLIGIGGVSVLMSRSLHLGGTPDRQPGRHRVNDCIRELVDSVRADAQASASGFQSDELGGADARRRSVAGYHCGRAGRIS